MFYSETIYFRTSELYISELYSSKGYGVVFFFHQWVDTMHSLLSILKCRNTHGNENLN